MRYTPYLDSIGVTFDESIPDRIVNILDAALGYASSTVKWGSFEGKARKPCPENPLLLAGAPIGQYHCPACGMMVMAAMPHLSPEADDMFPAYEVEMVRAWPAGYEE